MNNKNALLSQGINESEYRRFIVNPNIGEKAFEEWCQDKGLTRDDVLYLLINVKLNDICSTVK